MKFFTVLSFLFIFIFKTSAFAEIILDQNFPLEMRGIWSSNCNSNYNIKTLIIYDYGSLYIEYGDNKSDITVKINDQYIKIQAQKGEIQRQGEKIQRQSDEIKAHKD